MVVVSSPPVARGPNIPDEGHVYWVSFENEDLRVTEDMASEVLDSWALDEHYKLFTVVGKVANAFLASVTEEGGASDHSIEGNNVICGIGSAFALHCIGQHMWEKGRQYLVFARYELRPLPIQEAELGPMFTPEEGPEFVNCFVHYVVDHFRNELIWADGGLSAVES